MSIFGPKKGTFSLRSKSDERWNKSWRVDWLVTAGLLPEAEEWIRQREEELGESYPKDLTMSFWKD